MSIRQEVALTGKTINTLAYTFALTPDISPSGIYSRQMAVTGVGGTGGVTVLPHTLENPFTWTFVRQGTYKPIVYTPAGAIKSIPNNTNKMVFRKGLKALPSVVKVGMCTVTFDIPSGATTNDANGIAALYSFVIGFLEAERDGLYATQISGLL